MTPADPCTVLFFSATRQWWHEVWEFHDQEGDPDLLTHYVEIEAP
jgi:hypothetical protein